MNHPLPRPKFPDSYWANSKTKAVAKWILNNPSVYGSAKSFVLKNPEAPIIYRAWIKAENLEQLVTEEGISVLDRELNFGQLSEVLLTLRFNDVFEPLTSSNVGLPSEIKSPNVLVKTPRFTKKTKLFQWSIVVLLFVAFGGGLNYFDSVKKHLEAVTTLDERNAYANKCFELSGEELAAKAGPVGSEARNSAVVRFYEKVIKSECVIWGDGSIYRNPFFGANENSWNWQELKSAAMYSATRWNGVEPLTVQCADGWNSNSIGKSGACSYHGGVSTGFNNFDNLALINQLHPTSPVYPSLSELERAVRETA